MSPPVQRQSSAPPSRFRRARPPGDRRGGRLDGPRGQRPQADPHGARGTTERARRPRGARSPSSPRRISSSALADAGPPTPGHRHPCSTRARGTRRKRSSRDGRRPRRLRAVTTPTMSAFIQHPTSRPTNAGYARCRRGASARIACTGRWKSVRGCRTSPQDRTREPRDGRCGWSTVATSPRAPRARRVRGGRPEPRHGRRALAGDGRARARKRLQPQSSNFADAAPARARAPAKRSSRARSDVDHGKSACYGAPAFEALFRDPDATAAAAERQSPRARRREAETPNHARPLARAERRARRARGRILARPPYRDSAAFDVVAQLGDTPSEDEPAASHLLLVGGDQRRTPCTSPDNLRTPRR